MPSTMSHSIPNRAILDQVDDLQQRTAEIAYRCQLQLRETEQIGELTLDVLQEQRKTIASIDDSTEALNDKLDHSNKLLNRFDLWAGHWYGRNKRIARKEGKQALKDMKLTSSVKGTVKVTEKQNPTKYDARIVESMRSELFMSQNANSIQGGMRKLEDSPFVLPLDENTRNELKQIELRDSELDHVLDDMAESLDRLANISKLMKDDAVQSKTNIEKAIVQVDQLNEKQFVVQRRLRRNLNK
jgi:Snare region anchored in the vesicle membrane C-terminus